MRFFSLLAASRELAARGVPACSPPMLRAAIAIGELRGARSAGGGWVIAGDDLDSFAASRLERASAAEPAIA